MSGTEKGLLFGMVGVAMVASLFGAYVSYRTASGLQGVTSAASTAGSLFGAIGNAVGIH